MKRSRLSLVFVFVLLIGTVLVACAEEGTTPNDTQEEGNAQENVNGIQNGGDEEDTANGEEDWPKGLTVGTGSVGGIYHAWAGGWTNILSSDVGIPLSIEVTGGGADNAKLVEQGKIDIGLAADGIIYAGMQGTEWAEGEVHENLRAMFPMYPGYFQLHALTESGIDTVHDLEGVNFAPGPAGSSADTYWRTVLDFFEIEANIMNMGYSDATSQMQDGLVDVIGLAPTGVPHPSTAEIATTHDVTIFGISADDIELLQEEYPYMQVGEIPAETYKGQDEAVETIVLWNVYFTHKDMPDSLVYELVKQTFDKHEQLVQAHASAVDTLPENVGHLTVPLHQGAYQYYEDEGYDIPEEAHPIN